jgi:hypothetical protein
MKKVFLASENEPRRSLKCRKVLKTVLLLFEIHEKGKYLGDSPGVWEDHKDRK